MLLNLLFLALYLFRFYRLLSIFYFVYFTLLICYAKMFYFAFVLLQSAYFICTYICLLALASLLIGNIIITLPDYAFIPILVLLCIYLQVTYKHIFTTWQLYTLCTYYSFSWMLFIICLFVLVTYIGLLLNIRASFYFSFILYLLI